MSKVVKRTRQFFRALCAKMGPADHALVGRCLDETEKSIFYRMDTAIQVHCVNVARTMETLLGGLDTPGVSRSLLLKAALLHDIGKSDGRFTVLDRVWYVLVRKISRRLASQVARQGSGGWLARLRNAFFIHIHHGELGAELAARAGFPDELVSLIRHHHDPAQPGDPAELRLLRRADELN